MRYINLKQIFILSIVLFFLFGDLKQLRKKLSEYFKKIMSFTSSKSRKKGI